MAGAKKTLNKEMEALESTIMEVRHRIDGDVREIDGRIRRATDVKRIVEDRAPVIVAAAFATGIAIALALGKKKASRDAGDKASNGVGSKFLFKALSPVVSELMLQAVRNIKR